jgi:TonB family protein
MTKRIPLFLLATYLLLASGCQAPEKAEETKAEKDCSMNAWGATLELGLRGDEESGQKLNATRFDNQCALEIRKLSEVLLDDRFPERKTHPEKPAKVRFKDPDLRTLQLGKQPAAQVILELTIDATGKVTKAEFLEPHPQPTVNQLFIETAKSWLFRPAREGDAYRESKLQLSAIIRFP